MTQSIKAKLPNTLTTRNGDVTFTEPGMYKKLRMDIIAGLIANLRMYITRSDKIFAEGMVELFYGNAAFYMGVSSISVSAKKYRERSVDFMRDNL